MLTLNGSAQAQNLAFLPYPWPLTEELQFPPRKAVLKRKSGRAASRSPSANFYSGVDTRKVIVSQGRYTPGSPKVRRRVIK